MVLAPGRRPWLFRGLIALLGVLVAGLLADEVVQLRGGGVSTLVPYSARLTVTMRGDSPLPTADPRVSLLTN